LVYQQLQSVVDSIAVGIEIITSAITIGVDTSLDRITDAIIIAVEI
jgi:hypothetical protein